MVDDDTKLLTFLACTLKRDGFHVLTANDGCEVPDLLLQHHIDVILLDLQMPGMNGWEVMRAISRARPPAQPGAADRTVKPKVVVLSGRNEDDTASFVRRLGADAYLTKPTWGDQVVAAVRGVLTG